MANFTKQYFTDLSNGNTDKYTEILQICKELIQCNTNKPITIFKGCGNNGKSLLVQLLTMLIQSIFGNESIKYISIEQLKSNSPLEIAKWYNSELKYIIIPEIDNKTFGKLGGKIKELVSSDTISIRPLYGQEIVTIKPNLKIIMMTNSNIDVADRGLQYRMKIIDMDAIFNNNNATKKNPSLLNSQFGQYLNEIRNFIETYGTEEIGENDELDDEFEDDVNEYIMKISI